MTSVEKDLQKFKEQTNTSLASIQQNINEKFNLSEVFNEIDSSNKTLNNKISQIKNEIEGVKTIIINGSSPDVSSQIQQTADQLRSEFNSTTNDLVQKSELKQTAKGLGFITSEETDGKINAAIALIDNNEIKTTVQQQQQTLTGYENRLSRLEQNVNGFELLTEQDVNGIIDSSSLKVKVDEIQSQVSSHTGDISRIDQKADNIQLSVQNLDNSIESRINTELGKIDLSTYATKEGLTGIKEELKSEIDLIPGKIDLSTYSTKNDLIDLESRLTIDVDGIKSEVNNYTDGKFSEINQRADSIEQTVSSLDGSVNTRIEQKINEIDLSAYTKTEDLSGIITEEVAKIKIDPSQIQLDTYSKSEIDGKVSELEGKINVASDNIKAEVSESLNDYATKSELDLKADSLTLQSIKSDLETGIENVSKLVITPEQIQSVVKTETDGQFSEINQKLGEIDLSVYATKEELPGTIKEEVSKIKIDPSQVEIDAYSVSEVDGLIENLQGQITVNSQAITSKVSQSDIDAATGSVKSEMTSLINQTASDITSTVNNYTDGLISEVRQEAGQISQRVEEVNGNIGTQITQSINELNLQSYIKEEELGTKVSQLTINPDQIDLSAYAKTESVEGIVNEKLTEFVVDPSKIDLTAYAKQEDLNGVSEQLSILSVSVEGIDTRVENLSSDVDTKYSAINQRVDDIDLTVYAKTIDVNEQFSNIHLNEDQITLSSYAKIADVNGIKSELEGKITTSANEIKQSVKDISDDYVKGSELTSTSESILSQVYDKQNIDGKISDLNTAINQKADSITLTAVKTIAESAQSTAESAQNTADAAYVAGSELSLTAENFKLSFNNNPVFNVSDGKIVLGSDVVMSWGNLTGNDPVAAEKIRAEAAEKAAKDAAETAQGTANDAALAAANANTAADNAQATANAANTAVAQFNEALGAKPSIQDIQTYLFDNKYLTDSDRQSIIDAAKTATTTEIGSNYIKTGEIDAAEINALELNLIKGNLGGWTINSDGLTYGTPGQENSAALNPNGKEYSLNNETQDWTITAGDSFGVTKDGEVYATKLKKLTSDGEGSLGGLTWDKETTSYEGDIVAKSFTAQNGNMQLKLESNKLSFYQNGIESAYFQAESDNTIALWMNYKNEGFRKLNLDKITDMYSPIDNIIPKDVIDNIQLDTLYNSPETYTCTIYSSTKNGTTIYTVDCDGNDDDQYDNESYFLSPIGIYPVYESLTKRAENSYFCNVKQISGLFVNVWQIKNNQFGAVRTLIVGNNDGNLNLYKPIKFSLLQAKLAIENNSIVQFQVVEKLNSNDFNDYISNDNIEYMIAVEELDVPKQISYWIKGSTDVNNRTHVFIPTINKNNDSNGNINIYGIKTSKDSPTIKDSSFVAINLTGNAFYFINDTYRYKLNVGSSIKDIKISRYLLSTNELDNNFSSSDISVLNDFVYEF